MCMSRDTTQMARMKKVVYVIWSSDSFLPKVVEEIQEI